MRSISIEIKMIVSVIFFTFFLVGLERYQLSENIVEQFVESKKSKNKLLIETIAPIIGLNLSLGLDGATTEYLDTIVKQNSDLIHLSLINAEGTTIYHFSSPGQKLNDDLTDIHFCSQPIADPITEETLGTLALHFDDHEYQQILLKNKETTAKIFAVTVVLLILFTFLIKREFKFLKELSEKVLVYDPKLNNFPLAPSDRSDEVGVIHNAIIAMVRKIHSHAMLLDEINQSLEEKISDRTKELKEANKRLEELSSTDPLTQLANRRHFEKHIHDIWQLAKRKRVPVSIIMCDIDHFKKINDTHGHLVGDIVLKETALILQNSLKRSSDFVARYGGEEFIIALYDTDINGAEELCISVQNNLINIDGFHCQEAKTSSVTLSFGIASMIPDDNNRYEDLVHIADTALYQAKENGRNRIVIAHPPLS